MKRKPRVSRGVVEHIARYKRPRFIIVIPCGCLMNRWHIISLDRRGKWQCQTSRDNEQDAKAEAAAIRRRIRNIERKVTP